MMHLGHCVKQLQRKWNYIESAGKYSEGLGMLCKRTIRTEISNSLELENNDLRKRTLKMRTQQCSELNKHLI